MDIIQRHIIDHGLHILIGGLVRGLERGLERGLDHIEDGSGN
jgi:hypothetical protein